MNSFFFKLRRTTMFMFLLVMPIGVRIDPENPNEFSISAHGGAGQVVSVIRDCDGNAVNSAASTFVDVAGSAQISHRFDSGIITAFGIRGGYLESNSQNPQVIYNYGEETTYSSYEEFTSYSYFNPYIAMESKYVGIGVGYMGGDPQAEFGDESSEIPFSAHLRLGNYTAANFLVTVNEDLPLASGGGPVKVGLAYPVGSRGGMFSGFSGGFYDNLGFVQQAFLPISSRFDLDLALRLGLADSKFEGGVSVGVRYHLPFGGAEENK